MAYALSTLFTDYDKKLRLNHAFITLQFVVAVVSRSHALAWECLGDAPASRDR